MKPGDVLPELVLRFGVLSLIAVGGATTVVPEMHRWLVDSAGWVTDREFVELYAIAQAAPGPNVLIVTLLGWKLAGLAGAIVATLAICAPSGLLTYGMAQVWHRFRAAPWRVAVQSGMAPLTVGLILATGYILAQAADRGWATAAVTAATTVVVLTTRLNPLWLLGAAGALGLLGLL
jgi:chromate transporter